MSTEDTDTIEISPKFWARKIREMAAEGTLRQHVWNDTDEHTGRHIACILGAAGDNITGTNDVPCAALCMPTWLASLTPQLFDGVPRARATEFALKYADVIDGWCVLNERGWQRVQIGFILFCTRQGLTSAQAMLERARGSAYRKKTVEIYTQLVALLEERDAEVRGPGEAALAADAAYAARAARAARAAALAADAARAARAARAAALAADAADAARAARAADAAREAQFDELIRLIDEQIRLVAE